MSLVGCVTLVEKTFNDAYTFNRHHKVKQVQMGAFSHLDQRSYVVGRFLLEVLASFNFQPSPQVDAGPWLPQCVKSVDEGKEGFYGRAVREPPDPEAAQRALGDRDLPRVNARREMVGREAFRDPPGAFSPAQQQPQTNVGAGELAATAASSSSALWLAPSGGAKAAGAVSSQPVPKAFADGSVTWPPAQAQPQAQAQAPVQAKSKAPRTPHVVPARQKFKRS